MRATCRSLCCYAAVSEVSSQQLDPKLSWGEAEVQASLQQSMEEATGR